MYQTSLRKSLIINGALGRHGEGRYGGWGDGNEFSEGSLEEMVMMMGKIKKQCGRVAALLKIILQLITGCCLYCFPGEVVRRDTS